MDTAVNFLIYILQGATLADDQESARATGNKLLAWSVTGVTLGDVVYTINGKGDFEHSWYDEAEGACWMVSPKGDTFVEGTLVPIDSDVLAQTPLTIVDTEAGEAHVYAAS
jgi:hypothetical protein